MLKASWLSWCAADSPQVGPTWLQWAWTLLFCVVLAAAFTVAGFLFMARGVEGLGSLRVWALWYGRNLVMCLTVGLLIHVLFQLSLPRLRPRLAGWRPWQRTLYFMGLPVAGVLVGWPLGFWLIGGDLLSWASTVTGTRTLIGSLLVSAVLMVLLQHAFNSSARQALAEKRATEAQLKLLQAQIEPHFLFNTLANVQSLIDHDTAKAREMLDAFTSYLRASLGGLRRESVPLDDELALARAYLRVQQVRMEQRLSFRIEASEAARGRDLMPLLLQPLVENAVQHGIEPSVAGGSISVRAQVDGDRLVLEVQDDGQGLSTRPAREGQGLALDNIRERLSSRYGPEARLELEPTHPGTRARLTLPARAAQT